MNTENNKTYFVKILFVVIMILALPLVSFAQMSPITPDGEPENRIIGTATFSLKGGASSKNKETINATRTDQSVIKISDKGSLSLVNSTLTKTGDASAVDMSNFFGLNAAILSEAGSKINIVNTKVTTKANCSNAVFSTGQDSNVNLSNVTLRTTGNCSSGLDVTKNGSIFAENIDVLTNGISSAAIAIDRGQGFIHVNNSNLKTTGKESPVLYSTGNMTVTNTKGSAVSAEAAIINGANSITLTDTNLTSNKKNGVTIYRTFSPDTENGIAKLSIAGGSIKANTGAMFYVTNTQAEITLNKTSLSAKSGTILNSTTDIWGKKGANGGNATLIVSNMNLVGNILCDSSSSVKLVLKNKVPFKGMINHFNKGKLVSVFLDSGSTWTVTGNSYVSAFSDANAKLTNIIANGQTIFYDRSNPANDWLKGRAIKLKGGGRLRPAVN